EVGLEIDEFPGECAHLSGPASAPTKFDADVAAFRPAQLLQPLLQSCNATLRLRIVCVVAAQHRDPPYPVRRLRRRSARRKQPSSHTAEKHDERAAPHSITSSARTSTVGGMSMPSALAAFRLMTVWYLVGACTGRSAGFSPLRMRST